MSVSHSFLLVGSLLISQLAFAATDKKWDFNVYLNDQLIGRHIFDVSSNNDESIVRIKSELEVKVLFLTAYRYQHQNIEQWRDGCLVSLQSTTNDDGKPYTVIVTSSSKTTEIKRNEKTDIINQGCMSSYSYWDKSIVDRDRLINPQTGLVDEVNIKYIDEIELSLEDTHVLADQYELVTEKFTITLWYLKNGEWAGLQSETEDGHQLFYRRRS